MINYAAANFPVDLGQRRDKVAYFDGRLHALVLQDKQDKEIAAELGLSIHTIRTYLSRIFTRLGVTDRLGVVLRVAHQHRAGCPHECCPYK